MATTYTLINSNVLTSSAASVTFSSIPATYTDLVLRISARSDNGAVNDGLNMTFNGVGGTSYSRTMLRGNGSAATSVISSSTSSFQSAPNGVVGSTATSNTFGSIEIYVPSYLVSQNKPISYFGAGEDNNATAYMGVFAGLFSNTSAITSIVCSPVNGSNLVSGSSFYLYGISNA